MRQNAQTEIWKLSEAKNKFSQVFDLAIEGAPQVVRRFGRKNERVVVVSVAAYEKLAGRSKK